MSSLQDYVVLVERCNFPSGRVMSTEFWHQNWQPIKGTTSADLKISVYVCVHIKTIS